MMLQGLWHHGHRFLLGQLWLARAWDNRLHYFNKRSSTWNDVLSLMIQTYEYRKTFWITRSSDMPSVTLTIHIITSQPKCVVSQNSCNWMPRGKDKFEILNGSKWITINVAGKKRERRREQNSGESSALSDDFPVLDLGLCTLQKRSTVLQVPDGNGNAKAAVLLAWGDDSIWDKNTTRPHLWQHGGAGVM